MELRFKPEVSFSKKELKALKTVVNIKCANVNCHRCPFYDSFNTECVLDTLYNVLQKNEIEL